VRRLALLAACAALAAAPAAAAAARIELGVHGSPPYFDRLTGQHTSIVHVFIGFDQADGVRQVIANMGPEPMLALVPGSYGSHETASPRAIALGATDAFLFALNASIAAAPVHRFYLRPFPEMNGWWEAESAYNRNGSPRDAAHTTAWVKKAFARIAVIERGGTQSAVSAKLRALGLPGVLADLAPTGAKLRIVWNPQGYGSPDLPGNSAAAYYPGDAYVDVVGDDLYDIGGHGATWAAAQALYDAHPSKPFAFPEWGLWGIDDPSFVEQMASFVHTHRRIVFISYYDGGPGKVWDLASKPKSLAAYRRLIDPLA